MKNALLLCLALLAASCDHLAPPNEAYVRGDLERYNQLSPIILNLTDGDRENDPDFHPPSPRADSLRATLATWKSKIDVALRAIENAKPGVTRE